MWSTWPALVLLGVGVILASTALLTLYWAAKNGQFRNMEQGARVIFDDAEPVGQPTDMVFKDKKRQNLENT